MIKKFISICLVFLILCSCSKMPDNSTSLETSSEYIESVPQDDISSENSELPQNVEDYVFSPIDDLEIVNLTEYTGLNFSYYTPTPLHAIKMKNQIIFQIQYNFSKSFVYAYNITTKKVKLIEKFEDNLCLNGIFKLNETEFILIYTENFQDDTTYDDNTDPSSKYHKYNINNLNDYETKDLENFQILNVSNDKDAFYYYCFGKILCLDKNEGKKIVANSDQLIMNHCIFDVHNEMLDVINIDRKDGSTVFSLDGMSYHPPFSYPMYEYITLSDFDIILADNSKIFIKPYFYYDVKQKKGVVVDHLKKYSDEDFVSLSICDNKYVYTYSKNMIITDKNFNILKEINFENFIGPPIAIEDKLYFQDTAKLNPRGDYQSYYNPNYYYLDIDDYKITKIYQSES